MRHLLLLAAVALAPTTQAAWTIVTSEVECRAEWTLPLHSRVGESRLVLFENPITRAYRVDHHSDVDPCVDGIPGSGPMLFDDDRDHYGSWYVAAAPIVHFEIPLWRTGNVINKLRRCSRNISH